MKDRCRNPNNPQFKDYGGRGIGFVKRWNDFNLFLSDMGLRPVGKTLNRKNNNLGYSKKNCEWATWAEQVKNKRKRIFGASKTQGVWIDRSRKQVRWVAEIFKDNKRIYLGRFKTEAEAAKAVYNRRNNGRGKSRNITGALNA